MVVLVEDPYNQPQGNPMKFCLTYSGPLYATQQERPGQPSKHLANKHQLRSVFHKQLKELWRVLPALNGLGDHRPKILTNEGTPGFIAPLTESAALAQRHSLYGFNFVPLVTLELDLICGLEILLLRPDRPGSLIWAGDIDNRLKTLLDALGIPKAEENYSQKTPQADERPFFCLLEEDKSITRVSVETDRLLEPVNASLIDVHDARIIVTVTLRPYELHLWNLHFG